MTPSEAPPAIKSLTDSEKWALLARSDAVKAANDLCSKSPKGAAEITSELGVAYMSEVVTQLGSDAAADLLRNLPEDFGGQVLLQVTPGKSEDVRHILSYPVGTAGSMMAREFLSIPDGMSVADAIEYLHLLPSEKKGRTPYVYVLDHRRRPIGALKTQDLIFNPLDKAISSISAAPVISVEASMPKSEVAKLMQGHRFLALPVVDVQGEIVGIIPADNAIQAMREQADRDIAKMVGTGAEELKSGSIPRIMRLRLPWLLVSVASGLICAVIGEVFQHDGRTLAALFLFIPVILGISESTGIQGATIVVRSTAMGSLSTKELRRLFVKEIAIGVLIGLVCGALVGIITSLWQGSPLLGIAIAVSMNVAVFVSAIIGLALPLIFRAMRIDPALASGPLVLAICDLQTLFVYFNLANYILTR